MKKLYLLLMLALCITKGFSQAYKVDTLLYSGNPLTHNNLVMTGDGFTASQQSLLTATCTAASNYTFATVPFTQYKPTFNVFVIHAVSIDTGTTHPHTAPDCPALSAQPISSRNTAYSCSFDQMGAHRYIDVGNKAALYANIKTLFPWYSQFTTTNVTPIVICNTAYYGGGEYGTIATCTLNAQSFEILVHEMGHAIGGLTDEYRYIIEGWNSQSAFNSQSFLTWKLHVDAGKFSMAGGGISPYANCKMRALGQPFCPRCIERLTFAFTSLASPIQSAFPNMVSLTLSAGTSQNFILNVTQDNPNTMECLWLLDGQPAGSGFNYVLQNDLVAPGTHTLKAITQDGNKVLLMQPSQYSQSWTVTTVAPKQSLSLSVTPVFTIPATQVIAPSILATSNPDNYRVLMNWNAIPVPPGYIAVYYDIYFSFDNVNWSPGNSGITGTTATTTHLTGKTKYYVRMRVDYYNGANLTYSNWSPSQTFTTQ